MHSKMQRQHCTLIFKNTPQKDKMVKKYRVDETNINNSMLSKTRIPPFCGCSGRADEADEADGAGAGAGAVCGALD